MSGKNHLVTGIEGALGLGSFIVSICAGVRLLRLRTFQEVVDTPWILYTTAGCDLLADSSIACSLYFYLSKNSTGYKRTSSLLHTIALYVIGTGFITAIWDVVEVVTYAALNDTLLFGIFYLSLSKLYTNALLASLNARPMMQRKLEQDMSYLKSFGLVGLHQGSRGTSQRTPPSAGTDIELQSTVITLDLGEREGNTHTLTIDDASMTQTLASEKSEHI